MKLKITEKSLLSRNENVSVDTIKDTVVSAEYQPAYICKFYQDEVYFGEAHTCLTDDTRQPFLYDVKVEKEFRGRGLSKYIMEYMLDKFDIKILYVGKDNNVAINLYKQYGFKIVDGFEDTYVMGLE